MTTKDIIIKGEKIDALTPAQPTEDVLELQESYLMQGTDSNIGEIYTVRLSDENIIELVFEDDTVWYCNFETIEGIFPEATLQRRTTGGIFEIPYALKNSQTNSGLIKEALVKVVNIFKRKPVQKGIRDYAEDLERKQLGNQSGLYTLNSKFRLQKYTVPLTESPILLFIHGMASSTEESFGGIAKSSTWEDIYKLYSDSNILAFQHETLSKSPLQNAVELVDSLPTGANLQLITHSSGGLLGDILARFSTVNDNHIGFDDNEREYLKKADRSEDLKLIGQLSETIKDKRIKITKFIRVACPASGTVLASDRLDYFLNITLNLIGLNARIVATPVYSAFRNLVAVCIDAKNYEHDLPGIEAMNPNSHFIKVLNNPASEIIVDSPLAVISGNCKVKMNFRALFIISSKLFFGQDNDLIVNTRSMYLGSKRSLEGLFFLEQNKETDHFSYFDNEITVEAIKVALESVNTETIKGFERLEQDYLNVGKRNILLDLEGGQVFRDRVTGKRPIVVLLPGIMGSNLTHSNRLLWINYLRFLGGDISNLDIKENSNIKAPSLVKTSYKQIVDFLALSYDVVTCPFDWRLDMKTTANLFNNKLKSLLEFNQPIKLIGHSMGGVLIRDFILYHPDTWSALNKINGFRLIFLGAPLQGSFRIPSVLFGQDSIINKLSKVDIFHTKQELIEIFRSFPGLLSLLPLTTDNVNDFANEDIWTQMATGNESWPIPKGEDLGIFKDYRNSVLSNTNEIDYSNMVYIAGKDKATPCAYEIRDGKLMFLCTAEGDQSVTWESGIPKKMIENDSVYYANVTHGSLANEPTIFTALAEILEKGETTLLSKIRPATRTEEKLFPMPILEDFNISPVGLEKTLLGLEQPEKITVERKPLIVSISHGDLKFAKYPVLVGHFSNEGILQAENEIDKNLNGALSERLRLGLYPSEIGTSEVIITNNGVFPGTIVLGLGDYSSLTAFQLTKTVEQGVIKYLLKINETEKTTTPKKIDNGIGISPLLVGSRHGGLPIESVVSAILHGIYNANQKINNKTTNSSIIIEKVEFIELYEDRSMSCFYCLKQLEREKPEGFPIAFASTNGIRTIYGAKNRIVVENADGWYNRITVRLEKQAGGANFWAMHFNISTGGAREEQRVLFSSIKKIDQLVEHISVNNLWTPDLAKTIFELLIPNDFKDLLKRQSNILWVLDKYTATFPWELLQDTINDVKPICVNSGMVRQLATQDYRPKFNTVAEETGLVIADPSLQGFAIQLPGALKEGETVSLILQENGFDQLHIPRGTSLEIINALFRKDYKIIHLCGHGVFNPNSPEKSGMLIGKDEYLTTFEIHQMSVVPELVFVNCCYLGQTNGETEELFRNRYKLAANLGTQLIDNGVKVVVVAGWAVDDSAALEFTKVFYKQLFAGENFGDSVLEARKHVFNLYGADNNTWGAYQCYGDPYYRLRSKTENRKEKGYTYNFLISKEAEVELQNLKDEIEIGSNTLKAYLTHLNSISRAVDNAGIRNTLIIETEALIYADLGEFEQAIKLFDMLTRVENAKFSLSTIEKSLKIKAIKYVFDANSNDGLLPQSLTNLNNLVEEIKNLLKIGNTSERLCLLGSTYKRIAMLSKGQEKIDNFKRSAYYYNRAYRASSAHRTTAAFSNWIEMEGLLVHCKEHQWGEAIQFDNDNYELPEKDDVIKVLNDFYSSLNTTEDNMDFENEVDKTNALVSTMIVDPSLPVFNDGWGQRFKDHKIIWTKAGSRGQKLEEAQHLNILIDGIELDNNSNSEKLKKQLGFIKNELEQLIFV